MNIHGALQAIGLALLVLFFVIGVMRTCGSLAETKRPETALKLFIRFALAKGVVTYGLELMMALFRIVQGVISTIMNAAGFGSAQQTVLPAEIVTAVEDCGFFESIPLVSYTHLPNVVFTTDGKGKPYEHGGTENAVATISFAAVSAAQLPEPETLETEYELLSDEEIEALFHLS